MMTDGEHMTQGVGARFEGSAPVDDPAWVVAKSLLEVNDTCTDTLQRFLLYSSTDRVDELPADELSLQIDELIEQQRRTIAELELARDALRELDSQ